MKATSILCLFCVQALTYSGTAAGSTPLLEKVEPFSVLKAQAALDENQLKLLERMTKATVLVDADTNCSGVFVSNEGHMVTALHCLASSMDDERNMIYTLKQTSTGELARSIEVPRDKRINVMPLWIGMNLNSPAQPMPVTLIAVGRGYPMRVPDATASPEELALYHSNMEDFAILKFDALPKGVGCVKIATQEPTPSTYSEDVWHTGYPTSVKTLQMASLQDPVFAAKFETEGTLGTQWALDAVFPQYVARGRLFDTYGSLLAAVPEIGGSALPTDSILNEQIYRTSTAPVKGGFSGGGTFDRHGRLIGINAMRGLKNATKYDHAGHPNKAEIARSYDFGYGTSFVSISHVVRRLIELRGDETAKKTFRCSVELQQ